MKRSLGVIAQLISNSGLYKYLDFSLGPAALLFLFFSLALVRLFVQRQQGCKWSARRGEREDDTST